MKNTKYEKPVRKQKTADGRTVYLNKRGCK